MSRSAKPRYRVDLARQMADCEANYARIVKLLPGLDSQDCWQYTVQVGSQSQSVSIKVVERAKYTTTVDIAQRGPVHEWEEPPQLQVRLYHDAKLAEVLQWHQHKRMQVRYDYPNEKMFQADEKAQFNQFLGEWLNHCLIYGRSDQGLEAFGVLR